VILELSFLGILTTSVVRLILTGRFTGFISIDSVCLITDFFLLLVKTFDTSGTCG
jgi:hypothetical protein